MILIYRHIYYLSTIEAYKAKIYHEHKIKSCNFWTIAKIFIAITKFISMNVLFASWFFNLRSTISRYEAGLPICFCNARLKFLEELQLVDWLTGFWPRACSGEAVSRMKLLFLFGVLTNLYFTRFCHFIWTNWCRFVSNLYIKKIVYC